MLAATDGADEIEPAADGRSLRVVWRRWALIGGKAGELVDPHITSEVVWRLDGATLVRDETLRVDRGTHAAPLVVAVPIQRRAQRGLVCRRSTLGSFCGM